MYSYILKRAFDFLISLILIITLLPVFLFLTIILALSNNGSPFFIQNRPGLNERIFKIIKFRTMSNKKDIQGNLLPDGQRLTRVGSFVRKTSLDELPQLFNVIKGEMSFVGPRPLLPQYLSLYNAEQKKRHKLRPGITGWAQVNGRNSISWKEKLELDVWYVENISFLLDLRIILRTIKKVIITEGVNAEGQATTEGFKGNN